jgi:dTDP-4-dehydrorhamnose 3,5-epimerase
MVSNMKITPTSLPDVLIIEPRAFEDRRGFFMETYHQKRYGQMNIHAVFVQDNLSHSIQGILRGLHYQLHHPQAKLVQAVTGSIFDVAVDIRHGSPTFGKWVGANLTDENRHQIFVPEGFAHGFCVLSETADVVYKCTDFYAPGDEGGILWSDPGIGIDWPISDPQLSDKDSAYPCLRDVPREHLPVYKERT